MSSDNDTVSNTGSSLVSTENSLMLYDPSNLAGIFARRDGKKRTEHPKHPIPLRLVRLPLATDFRSANPWSLLDDEVKAETDDEDETVQTGPDMAVSTLVQAPNGKMRKRRQHKRQGGTLSRTSKADTTSTALTIVTAPTSSVQSTPLPRVRSKSTNGSGPQTQTTKRIEFGPDALLAMIAREEARQLREYLSAADDRRHTDLPGKAETIQENKQQEWRTKITSAYYALELSVQELAKNGVKLDGTAVSEKLKCWPDIRALLKEASDRATVYEAIAEDAYQWGEPQNINSEMWEYRPCGSFVAVPEEEIEKSVCMPDGTIVQGMTEPDENCPLNDRRGCTWDSICVHQMEWMADKINEMQALTTEDDP